MLPNPDNVSSTPDATCPDDRRPGGWIAVPHNVFLIAAAFFVFIGAAALIMSYRDFEAERRHALDADRTTANLIAAHLHEHNQATLGLLQSYARRPLFVDAVQRRDVKSVSLHLADLKKNAEIDLTFVTDPGGRLWANVPVYPEAIGSDLSHRNWYLGVRYRWQSYVSNVFKLIVADHAPAVAMAVPIFDGEERVVGILACSQRLSFLEKAIQHVPLDRYMTVSVIDRMGQTLYSNRDPYRGEIKVHKLFPLVESVLESTTHQIENDARRQGGDKEYITAFPVGDCGWTVISERPLRYIYQSSFGQFVETGVVSILLFLLIVFFLSYLRRLFLHRKTSELLETEMKLRQTEESERETREYLEKLIDTASVPIVVWDPQLKITRFNRSFEDLTGRQAQDVLGEEIGLLFPEDRREESLALTRLTAGGGRWDAIEIPILRKDGSERTVLWNSATLYGPDGRTALATIAQGLDITDRKHYEKAIEEEKERLKHALDEVRTLRGIIPICSNCKKIRDDKGYWNQVEQYLMDHTEAEFSHGICPACAEALYPDIYRKKKTADGH